MAEDLDRGEELVEVDVQDPAFCSHGTSVRDPISPRV